MPETIATITRPDGRSRIIVAIDEHEGKPFVRVVAERWRGGAWKPQPNGVTLEPHELATVADALRSAGEVIGQEASASGPGSTETRGSAGGRGIARPEAEDAPTRPGDGSAPWED